MSDTIAAMHRGPLLLIASLVMWQADTASVLGEQSPSPAQDSSAVASGPSLSDQRDREPPKPIGAWEPLLATGSPVTPEALRWSQASGALPESHGWIVIPGARGPLLQHVPPRGRVAGIDGTDLFARDGAIQHAAILPRAPEAMAAYGRRVYLLFSAEATPAGAGRRGVMAFDVEPTSLDGLWADKGQSGLRTLPSLPSASPLAGVSADEEGLLALLSPSASASARLILFHSGKWSELETPAWHGTWPAGPRLIDGENTVRVVVTASDGSGAIWQGQWRRTDSADPERDVPASLNWTQRPVSGSDFGVGANSPAFWSGERLIWARPIWGGALHLFEADEAGTRRLAAIEGVGSQWGVVPLAQSNRALVIWMTDPPPGKTAATGFTSRLTACEVSLLTGRVLYRGPAQAPTPISPGEIRWLAAGLLALMIVVLAVVLRSEGDRGVATLPEGFALAPPGARMLAGLIDAAVAVFIARALLREEWERVFDVSLSSRTLAIWGLAIAIGFAHTTLSEWLAGRSIGKALAGIRVVRIGYGPDPPPARRPSLAGALVRNVVRWLFAPYAMLSSLDPAGRHRGDVIAKTAVVVRVVDEQEGREA